MKHLHYIFRLVVAAMLCVAATSCVFMDEDDRRGTGGGEQGDASISLKINAGTRAISLDEETGTPEERMISSVRMVLYGADVSNPTDADYTVKEVFDFFIKSKPSGIGYQEWDDEEWNGEGWPADDPYGEGKHLYKSFEGDETTDRFITFARKVPRRDYKMLIIINAQQYPVQITIQSPTAGRPFGTRSDYENISLLEITEKGHRLTEFLTPAMLDQWTYEMNLNMARDKMFLMTNSNGLIDVPADRLQATEDDANENPIPVSVDRAVAKIIVEGDPEYWPSVPSGGRISNVTWDVQNRNRWFHWMRKQTNLIEGNAPGGVGQHETEVADPSRGKIYAEDPNFSGISESNGGTKAGILENFHVIENVGNSSFPYLMGEHQYVFENTMTGPEQYDDVMTSIIVSCQYTPENFNEWDDYFTYKGFFVSTDDVIAYYRGIKEVPSELQGIKETITKVVDTIDGVDEYGDPIHKYMDIYEYYGDWYLYPTNYGFDAYGLKLYLQGMHYFKIAVKHNNSNDRFTYGKYGVVRNYVYKISINDIKLPGFPGTPDYGYISAEIGIMDWATHDLREVAGDDTPLIEEKPPGVTFNVYHVVEERDEIEDQFIFKILGKETVPSSLYLYENMFFNLIERAWPPFPYPGQGDVHDIGWYKYSNNDDATVGDKLVEHVDYFDMDWEDHEWDDEAGGDVYRIKGYDGPDGTRKIYNFVILYGRIPT